eukprot:scaffold89491_cov21-Phaeocystis_antarctica.AAC.1
MTCSACWMPPNSNWHQCVVTPPPRRRVLVGRAGQDAGVTKMYLTEFHKYDSRECTSESSAGGKGWIRAPR